MVGNLNIGTAPVIERVSRWPDKISPLVPPSLVIGLFIDRIAGEAENPCLNVALGHKTGDLLGTVAVFLPGAHDDDNGPVTSGHLVYALVLDSHGRKLSKSERALKVDPSQPMPSLRRAFAFLGVAFDDTADDPAGLLHSALKHFDPHKLTQCSGHRMA